MRGEPRLAPHIARLRATHHHVGNDALTGRSSTADAQRIVERIHRTDCVSCPALHGDPPGGLFDEPLVCRAVPQCNEVALIGTEAASVFERVTRRLSGRPTHSDEAVGTSAITAPAVQADHKVLADAETIRHACAIPPLHQMTLEVLDAGLFGTTLQILAVVERIRVLLGTRRDDDDCPTAICAGTLSISAPLGTSKIRREGGTARHQHQDCTEHQELPHIHLH